MTEPATAARSLVVEREMPHPPEKIWRALTPSALIEAWLGSPSAPRPCRSGKASSIAKSGSFGVDMHSRELKAA